MSENSGQVAFDVGLHYAEQFHLFGKLRQRDGEKFLAPLPRHFFVGIGREYEAEATPCLDDAGILKVFHRFEHSARIDLHLHAQFPDARYSLARQPCARHYLGISKIYYLPVYRFVIIKFHPHCHILG